MADLIHLDIMNEYLINKTDDNYDPLRRVYTSVFFLFGRFFVYLLRLLPLFIRFLLIEGGRPIMLYFLKHFISSNYYRIRLCHSEGDSSVV